MSMMEEQTPAQSLAEVKKYHKELQKELGELILAQKKHPTKYKFQRIMTISKRLGIKIEPENS